MKIADTRKTLDTLNWHRRDATGGIAAVEALEIPPRFAKEIERRAWELEAAGEVLSRWHATQLEGVTL